MRHQWLTRGVVALSPFLSAQAFARLRSLLRPETPSGSRMLNETMATVLWDPEAEDGVVLGGGWPDARFTTEEGPQREEADRAVAGARARRDAGQYSYVFERSHSNFITGRCFSRGAGKAAPGCFRTFDPDEHGGAALHDEIEAVLRSAEIQRYLRAATGRGGWRLDTWFVSRYTRGHFLAEHTDSRFERKLAFVLQFTEGWRPEYGGLLLFMDPQGAAGGEVLHAFVPSPNSFTIFDVAEDPPLATRPGINLLPHTVSEVVVEGKARIAVSGWYTY